MSRPRTIADQALLTAARKVFLGEGIHAPVSAVAKELGVSVGALFFRMKSKEQLLARALMPPFPPPEVEQLEQGTPSGTDPRQHLLTLLTGLCNFLPEALPGFFLLHTAGVLPSKELCATTIDVAMRDALASWLRRARARKLISVANPAAAADAVIGAMEARFMHAYLLKRTFSSTQNRVFVKNLLSVVLGSPRRGRRP
jgi:AcrR family transcriptional regulator